MTKQTLSQKSFYFIVCQSMVCTLHTEKGLNVLICGGFLSCENFGLITNIYHYDRQKKLSNCAIALSKQQRVCINKRL